MNNIEDIVGKKFWKIMIRALPATPIAASDRIVFNSHYASVKSKDFPVIQIREEISPDDITGMNACS